MCRAAIDISLLWSERQNRITLPRYYPLPAQGYGTRRVPTTLLKNLKPVMCLYRFIRGILVGDLPINSFFRFEPKNLAIRVKFFTKKLLTDVSICCIIGRLLL